MKILFKRAAATAVIVLTGTMPIHAETLRIAFSCDYAPFNFRTSDGELKGYDVDVAHGVLENLGADIEEVCQKWDGMIPSLLANKFDLIVASMSITPKRLEQIDFSAPYRISVGRFIGKTDADMNLFDADGSPIPDNFSGITVGLERATTYESWIRAKLPDAKIALYDSNEAMFLDLRNGRVDTIMTNPMKAYLKFLATEEGSDFGFVSPALNEVEYFGIGVGIGMRKDNLELKARLNAALKELTEKGKLEEYSLKYFPFAINPTEWEGVTDTSKKSWE